MRQVGTRQERTLAQTATDTRLAEGADFSESFANLAPTTFIPKGVYRFRSHEEANRQQQDCLVRGIGMQAASRTC